MSSMAAAASSPLGPHQFQHRQHPHWLYALVGYTSAGMMKVVVLGPCSRRGEGCAHGRRRSGPQPVCRWAWKLPRAVPSQPHPITYEVGEEECQCVEDDKRPAPRLAGGRREGML